MPQQQLALAKAASMPNLHRSESNFKTTGNRRVFSLSGAAAAQLASSRQFGGADRPSQVSKMIPQPPPSLVNPWLSPKMHPWAPQDLKQALAARTTYAGFTSRDAGSLVVAGRWGVGPPSACAHKTILPKGVCKRQHVFEAKKHPATQFRRFYERGDLPISIKHGITQQVQWKVEPERLDYMFHLPIFFEGLLEKMEPYTVLAYQGLQDMLNAARGKEPSLISPAVPTLILPIKRALNTKDSIIMCRCINMLQLMLRCDERVGELLVPYYRQILPVFNLFVGFNCNLGDGIEYSQRKRENLGDLIQETLELLEKFGGDDAFVNIKYMIPTYESCVTPSD
mmetsp:Transcript_129433/g.210765  ORF Transcript_129433/g.210765 Transcript_129433/m.210765 type:complete len:339 (+) Transcript_129433:2-1018(+)